jgi:hypothetical protein
LHPTEQAGFFLTYAKLIGVIGEVGPHKREIPPLQAIRGAGLFFASPIKPLGKVEPTHFGSRAFTSP